MNIKLKSFYTAKAAVTRLKKLPMVWNTIFASNSSDKELTSRIYRELKKLNPQRINIPMKKWPHELNKEFSKEEVQIANKYMKYSTSLDMKEVQIKTTLRVHLATVRMTILKVKNNSKCW
jgi:hypothetical protein